MSPMHTETRYGMRMFFDGREDRYEDVLHLSLNQAQVMIQNHRAKMKLHTGWRVTKVVLLTQQVDVHPWLEREEEGAHGR